MFRFRGTHESFHSGWGSENGGTTDRISETDEFHDTFAPIPYTNHHFLDDLAEAAEQARASVANAVAAGLVEEGVVEVIEGLSTEVPHAQSHMVVPIPEIWCF